MRKLFEGIATAVVTPFDEKGDIDIKAFERILHCQLDAGINAVVICGTTGEGCVLSDEERRLLIHTAVKTCDRRIPVIAGISTNNFLTAKNLCRISCEAGADGLLIAAPYYNKPSQQGLYEYFNYLADFADKPVIVYNVPSRTGVNILPSTYASLAMNENIVGIKEANPDMIHCLDVIAAVDGKIAVYSGSDELCVPLWAVGGIGVISVVSNILPEECVKMYSCAEKCDFSSAAKIQMKLNPVIKELFSKSNPVPVKAVMEIMDFCKRKVRLPLIEMSDDEVDALKNKLCALGVR